MNMAKPHSATVRHGDKDDDPRECGFSLDTSMRKRGTRTEAAPEGRPPYIRARQVTAAVCVVELPVNQNGRRRPHAQLSPLPLTTAFGERLCRPNGLHWDRSRFSI